MGVLLEQWVDFDATQVIPDAARSGGRADLTLRVGPGRYSLWCSVADHRELGMRATLVVTR